MSDKANESEIETQSQPAAEGTPRTDEFVLRLAKWCDANPDAELGEFVDDDGTKGANASWLKRARTLERELAEAKELAHMQLAACDVATMQNTRSSAKERIDINNPYWTAAYHGVCNAVDREMNHRERAEAAESRLSAKCVCEFTGSGNERKINKTCAHHQAIKEAAVLAEREACARLCDEYENTEKARGGTLAEIIRARTGVPNDR